MDRQKLVAEGMLNVSQAAEFLQVGRSTIYNLMQAGKLHYSKIGRSRRVPLAAVRQIAADTLTGGWAIEERPENHETGH